MSPEMTAYFEAADKAVARAISDYGPRLQIPALNAMCVSKEEYEKAKCNQYRLKTELQEYESAQETFYKHLDGPSAHIDREVTAAIRFAVYRWGSVTIKQMWDSVKSFFPKQTWKTQKKRCADVERAASLECRKVIYLFVVRTVHRTGGLAFWRKNSRFHDRYDTFAAGYDELPEYCDRQTYSEERKSVGFANMHTVDTNPKTMDKTDPRHAYKQFNRARFLTNCEAAYHFLLDGPDGVPCLWATRQKWKESAQSAAVKAIQGLPAALRDIPGMPFGQEGQYERHATAPIMDPVRYGR